MLIKLAPVLSFQVSCPLEEHLPVCLGLSPLHESPFRISIFNFQPSLLSQLTSFDAASQEDCLLKSQEPCISLNVEDSHVELIH